MASDQFKSIFRQLTLLSGLFLPSLIFAASQVNFASPMGDEKWIMSGNQIRCGLSLTIPNYGIGYFEQYATQAPHFILRTWDEVLKPIPTQVIVKPPVWKPQANAIYVTRSFIKPGEYGIYLKREPTLKLLTYLSQGYQANVLYHSAEGFNVSVAISPIRFQKVYSKYQRCLGSLFRYNYDQVKESIFHFGVDSKDLTDEDKSQLKRIAKYVAVDIDVEQIKIIGYADDTGRKGYNNAVSQFRAEAVSKYLIKMGVPKKKISVTWVGALKPVGRNDTDEGRAANRRVIVSLVKK